MPERADLDARLPEVLEAVYGAYSIDWLSVPHATAIESLSSEALLLAMVLVELLPDEPEALGLAALMCLCEARRPARLDSDGNFVALDDQSRDRWDGELRARGERLLARAHGFARPGRFQYEAAIQSAHCAPDVDRHALRKLYRALMRVGPSLGAAVALAALDGEIDGADAGLRTLATITDRSAGAFQPAWVTRAHLLAEAGRARRGGRGIPPCHRTDRRRCGADLPGRTADGAPIDRPDRTGVVTHPEDYLRTHLLT